MIANQYSLRTHSVITSKIINWIILVCLKKSHILRTLFGEQLLHSAFLRHSWGYSKHIVDWTLPSRTAHPDSGHMSLLPPIYPPSSVIHFSFGYHTPSF